MKDLRRGLTHSTFRVLEHDDAWRVSLNREIFEDFDTRGDAIRGACLAARQAEAAGNKSEVLVGTDDQRMPHYEPQFGV